MEHTSPIRSLLAIMALVLGTIAAEGQVPDSLLRKYIVHEWDAMGQDVYRDARIPSFPDTTICYLYVGRKQNGPLWIRLQVRYAGYNRLDITKIRFSRPDKALEIEPMTDLLHYGTNGMMQWEWYDTPPSESEMRAIREIISAPGVRLTLYGKDRVEDRELSELERNAMGNVLEQARILGRVQR